MSKSDSFETEMIYRTMGGADSPERLGVGKMFKGGWSSEEPIHARDCYSLVYVVRGSGEYIDAVGGRSPLSVGSVFQRHPGKKHACVYDPDSGWSEYFIEIGAGLYQGLANMRIIRSEADVYQIEPDSFLEEEFLRLIPLLKECPESALPELSVELVGLLVSVLKRCHYQAGAGPNARMVSESCEYFAAHCLERLDLREYCRERHWGYEQFRKQFRLQVGISPKQYLIRRRLDRAQELLRTSAMTIDEIALELGYPNAFDFSRQFKRFVGVAPKFYRLNR